jgi:DHA2 family methylenomycin A resistance protein-like MFS transporter
MVVVDTMIVNVAQGAAAALMVPASLALVQRTYTDRDHRARAVAGWALIGGFAGAAGPLTGGALLTGAAGYLAAVASAPPIRLPARPLS